MRRPFDTNWFDDLLLSESAQTFDLLDTNFGLDGGAGNDTLSYAGSSSGVTVSFYGRLDLAEFNYFSA